MKNEFKNIVKYAKEQSTIFYSDENKENPNPYFLGFGNPNSEIIIFGKEKGFDFKRDKEQAKYESINNVNEWSTIVEKNINFTIEKSYPESTNYINCFIPYIHKVSGGHTWNKYSKIIEILYPNEKIETNHFLKKCFISEINYFPSEKSEIKKFQLENRLDFLKNDFFNSFKVIILSCGNYLSDKNIEEIFNVSFNKDLSLKRAKLKIFVNSEKIVVNTRQLSMDISDEYISKITTEIKEYLE